VSCWLVTVNKQQIKRILWDRRRGQLLPDRVRQVANVCVRRLPAVRKGSCNEKDVCVVAKLIVSLRRSRRRRPLFFVDRAGVYGTAGEEPWASKPL
jgi:hypothetical protein